MNLISKDHKDHEFNSRLMHKNETRKSSARLDQTLAGSKVGQSMGARWNGAGLISILLLATCAKSSPNPKNNDSENPTTIPTPVPVLTRESTPRLIRSDFATGEITQLCDTALSDASKKLDNIGEQLPKTSPLDALLSMEETLGELSDKVTPLSFMGYVSVDENLSAEGSQCEAKTSEFSIEVFSRKKLFDLISAPELEKSLIEPAKISLLKYWKTNFTINGLNLPLESQEKITQLKKELASLENEFTINLNQNDSTLAYTKDELEGVSQAFLNRLKIDDQGKYIVTTKSTDYTAVMDLASRSSTREKMLFAYENVAAGKNVVILEKALETRLKIAKLFGNKNWAEYRIQNRMVPSAKDALDFLLDLKQKLKSRTSADLQKLLSIKQKQEPESTELKPWDVRYLSNIAIREEFNVDQEAIRNFFPAQKAIEGMFRVYSTLLDVEFKEITQQVGTKPWHPSVKLYEVISKETGKAQAYFYTDFEPRSGKYSHAAAFSLITGRLLPDATYSLPVSSIVANFTPPSGDKPSLLSHQEVSTLFHEFGHIMHQTLTLAPYNSITGSSVAQDFVEAPSQMMENWVWNRDVLKSISSHYQTGKPLDDALIQSMIAAKNFNLGYLTSRQLVFGLQDLLFHTSETPVDTTKVQKQIYKDVFGITPQEGTASQASFGHLMGGYDAGYYGYLWSKVYSDDMFTKFDGPNIYSAVVGKSYKNLILESGSIANPLALLEKFLGRKPNSDAFFKKLEEGNITR